MQALNMIRAQLQGVKSLFHAVASDLTPEEWVSRPGRGFNLPGFTLWHMARTQDLAVQVLIRGVPEIAALPRWNTRIRHYTGACGIGPTLSQADRIAHEVTKEEVLAYQEEVHNQILAWLQTLDDEALNGVPDFEAHLAPYPYYQSKNFLAELIHLNCQPAWRYLTGPCIGHLREHLGELAIIKQLLRPASIIEEVSI